MLVSGEGGRSGSTLDKRTWAEKKEPSEYFSLATLVSTNSKVKVVQPSGRITTYVCRERERTTKTGVAGCGGQKSKSIYKGA